MLGRAWWRTQHARPRESVLAQHRARVMRKGEENGPSSGQLGLLQKRPGLEPPSLASAFPLTSTREGGLAAGQRHRQKTKPKIMKRQKPWRMAASGCARLLFAPTSLQALSPSPSHPTMHLLHLSFAAARYGSPVVKQKLGAQARTPCFACGLAPPSPSLPPSFHAVKTGH